MLTRLATRHSRAVFPCQQYLLSATPTTSSSISHPLLVLPPPHHPLSSRHPRKRPFSTTPPLLTDNTKTYYDILSLPPHCTKSQLKTQFYSLSKTTHPDLHPNDPDASTRFSQISEAYSVLADPEKRKKYDRDVLPGLLRRGGGRRSRGTPGGDGEKGSYMGSRPASGLSKRRTTFRGPPPSFYAHGGRDSDASGFAGSQSDPHSSQSQYQSQSQDYTFDPNDPASFDPRFTQRTQTVEDSRRLARQAAARQQALDDFEASSEADFWARFVIISFVVVAGITVASLIAGRGGGGGLGNERGKGGMVGGDGRRRGDNNNK